MGLKVNSSIICRTAYFALVETRGQHLGKNYRRFCEEDRNGIPADTRQQLLVQLLDHCKQNVPYYQKIIAELGDGYRADPEAYLRQMPVLSKAVLRKNVEQLKSKDLDRRKWFLMTSGGSTGEPVNVVQDLDSDAWIGAISLLFSRLVGREVGECEIMLWGSLRDITEGTEGWKARLLNRLMNTTFLNSFHMTQEGMREYIRVINTCKPRLITAYVETLYELARFSESQNLPITACAPIISSAGTLYPFMREKIERVFQACVYNRYGSRETGDVACERPGRDGLWVAPWGNYIEIADADCCPVPDGEEGNILITCLGNYAMPLIRYQIGDRGVLSPRRDGPFQKEQVLESVVGRTVDVIYNSKGEIVQDGYLLGLLDFKDWIAKYQLVQKRLDCLEYRIVPANDNYTQAELQDVAEKARDLMGKDTEINFVFLDKIPDVGTSGKFRYVLSEISRQVGCEHP
jgi:phenylacetate-CoA ligase